MAVPFYIPDKAAIKKTDYNKSLDINRKNFIYWQMIAQAVCNALKEYHLQSLTTGDGFLSNVASEFQSCGRIKRNTKPNNKNSN